MASRSAVFQYWECKARGDVRTSTIKDLYLRDLEILAIQGFLRRGTKVADVGCGSGYSTGSLAPAVGSIVGIDYSPAMIDRARRAFVRKKPLRNVEFRVGDILEEGCIPEGLNTVVTTRCLINLPGWDAQKHAIANIHRSLPSGGRYLMLESREDALRELNSLRRANGLKLIRRNWHNVWLEKRRLASFLRPMFRIIAMRSFGYYFYVSRIVHPVLRFPEEPKFRSPINRAARDACARLMHEDSLERISLNALYVLEKV